MIKNTIFSCKTCSCCPTISILLFPCYLASLLSRPRGRLVSIIPRLEGGSLHLLSFRSRNIDGLDAAVIVLNHLKLDSLSISEAAEALTVNSSLVDEDVGATVLGDDESESLLGIEPLDAALLYAVVVGWFGWEGVWGGVLAGVDFGRLEAMTMRDEAIWKRPHRKTRMGKRP